MFVLETYDVTKDSHTFLRNSESKFIFSKKTGRPIFVSPWLLYLVSDLCTLTPCGLNFLGLFLQGTFLGFLDFGGGVFGEFLAGTPCMEEKSPNEMRP